MTVKITNPKQTSNKPFPKLMISDMGRIVLFREEFRGTLIAHDPQGIDEIGYTSSSWQMDSFVDFDGEIMLKND
jgi:hypothetical protein